MAFARLGSKSLRTAFSCCFAQSSAVGEFHAATLSVSACPISCPSTATEFTGTAGVLTVANSLGITLIVPPPPGLCSVQPATKPTHEPAPPLDTPVFPGSFRVLGSLQLGRDFTVLSFTPWLVCQLRGVGHENVLEVGDAVLLNVDAIHTTEDESY